jgi:hypothetical protein
VSCVVEEADVRTEQLPAERLHRDVKAAVDSSG